MDAIGKKVSCGKCGSDAFNAHVASREDLVLITFVCTSCGHHNRAGVKRAAAEKREAQKEKKGFIQRLRESLFGAPSQRFDIERDLESVVQESEAA